jgi:zinc transporter ZupT
MKFLVTNDDASCRLISNTTDQPSTRIIIGDGAVAETSCCKIQTAIGDSSRIQISSTTTCKTSECPVTFLSMEVAEPERCETNCDRVKEDPPILMKSRPHAHSHGTRSVTIVLAIAFHAIIEGLALGVQVIHF